MTPNRGKVGRSASSSPLAGKYSAAKSYKSSVSRGRKGKKNAKSKSPTLTEDKLALKQIIALRQF